MSRGFVAFCIGFAASIAAAVVLESFGWITIALNAPQVEYVGDFGSVIEKAADVMNAADDTLLVAIDAACYGRVKREKQYVKYRQALESARARRHLHRHFIWLPPEAHEWYGKKLEDLGEDLTIALEESNDVRALLRGDYTEKPSIWLRSVNFWVAKQEDGGWISLLAFNTSLKGHSVDVIGLVTNSPAIAEALLELHKVIQQDPTSLDTFKTWCESVAQDEARP